MQASWIKLFEKLKIGIKVLVGQVVLELLIKTVICMFQSRTTKPTMFLHLVIKDGYPNNPCRNKEVVIFYINKSRMNVN